MTPSTTARGPDPGATVIRFGATERLLHWAVALPFLVLLVTGVLLGLPDAEVLLAHREVLHQAHLASAIGLLLLPALVLLLGDRQAVLRDMGEIDGWDREDWQWLRRAPLPGRLRRAAPPPAGRFNAGQKLNSVLVGAAITVLVVSGALMWKAERFPLGVGEVATQLHDVATLLMVPLVLGHIFLAVLNPATRPSLRGMLDGRVRAAWAAEHHGREAGR